MAKRWWGALLVTGAFASNKEAHIEQCDELTDPYAKGSCKFFTNKAPECPCFKGLGTVEGCRSTVDPLSENADLACCGAISKEDWLCAHTHWDKCKGFVDGETYAETQYGHLAYLCTTDCQELLGYDFDSGKGHDPCTGGLARQNRNCAEIQCTLWAQDNPNCPCTKEVSKVYECSREYQRIDLCCDEFPPEVWTCDPKYHDVCDLSVPWGQPGETIPFEKLVDICVGWKEEGEMPVWHEDSQAGGANPDSGAWGAVLMLVPFLLALDRSI